MLKINTRSPFYITANSLDAPVVIPPTAPLQTIQVNCGQKYSTATDVGENLFEFNTSEVGDVLLTITGNQIPIRFVAEWNGSQADTGYIGLSDYDAELIAANVDPLDINTDNPSNKDTIITINKATANPTLVTLRAYAPLVNDDYEVTFTCPEPVVADIPCGAGSQYAGGPAFPQVDVVELGSSTGIVTLTFNARNLPDKFIVEFDGVEVINTGYRGSASYQTTLNTALAELGLNAETIQGVGAGTATFQKTTASTTATVRVFAPINTPSLSTVWDYTLSCPQ
tara:strand:+ start:977 stop:1825 length:849 start_codon:yes stop_codon:yes gene_type:complete